MTGNFYRHWRTTAQDLMQEIHEVTQLGMAVPRAAEMLDEVGIVPVVDSRGRCIGLFTVADYQRWRDRDEPIESASCEEVRHFMTTRFTVATPDMSVEELEHRLETVDDPFLIVLDRQARPRGVVLRSDLREASQRPSRFGRVISLAN